MIHLRIFGHTGRLEKYILDIIKTVIIRHHKHICLGGKIRESVWEAINKIVRNVVWVFDILFQSHEEVHLYHCPDLHYLSAVQQVHKREMLQ